MGVGLEMFGVGEDFSLGVWGVVCGVEVGWLEFWSVFLFVNLGGGWFWNNGLGVILWGGRKLWSCRLSRVVEKEKVLGFVLGL